MPFMFENLAVYQKAVDFTEQIVTLTESFPHGYLLSTGRELHDRDEAFLASSRFGF